MRDYLPRYAAYYAAALVAVIVAYTVLHLKSAGGVALILPGLVAMSIGDRFARETGEVPDAEERRGFANGALLIVALVQIAFLVLAGLWLAASSGTQGVRAKVSDGLDVVPALGWLAIVVGALALSWIASHWALGLGARSYLRKQEKGR
jgi:hypothetical protein